MLRLTESSPLTSLDATSTARHQRASDAEINTISGRSMVCVIVHMKDVANVQVSLRDTWPSAPLSSTAGDPTGLWLAPNQCLLVSSTQSAETICKSTRERLGSVLCSITDVSSSLAVLSLTGSGSRKLLSAGCGVNFSPDSFGADHCARTRFADVPLIIHRRQNIGRFELYVDRAYASHLWNWLVAEAQ